MPKVKCRSTPDLAINLFALAPPSHLICPLLLAIPPDENISETRMGAQEIFLHSFGQKKANLNHEIVAIVEISQRKRHLGLQSLDLKLKSNFFSPRSINHASCFPLARFLLFHSSQWTNHPMQGDLAKWMGVEQVACHGQLLVPFMPVVVA